MEKTVIIVTDLGHFKAHRITKDPHEASARSTLIESYDSLDAHGKLGDKLSDTAGKFRGTGKKNLAAKGHGERHNIHLETEKRLVKMIAKDIDTVICNEGCEQWYLAASEKINRQIVEKLTPEVKKKLQKNVCANLTKVANGELLGYFN